VTKQSSEIREPNRACLDAKRDPKRTNGIPACARFNDCFPPN